MKPANGTNKDEIRDEGEIVPLPVTCWICHNCGFTFDTSHVHEDGTYSCPVCNEARLEARESKLEKALEYYGDRANHDIPEAEIIQGGSLTREWIHYPSPMYVDHGKIARQALGLDPTSKP